MRRGFAIAAGTLVLLAAGILWAEPPPAPRVNVGFAYEATRLDGTGFSSGSADLAITVGQRGMSYLYMGVVSPDPFSQDGIAHRNTSGHGTGRTFEEYREWLEEADEGGQTYLPIRPDEVPFVSLDFTFEPKIGEDGAVHLEAKVRLRRFQRYDEEGNPVFEHVRKSRELRIPLGREALWVVYTAPEEVEHGPGEIILRLSGEVLASESKAWRGRLRYERIEATTDRVVARAEARTSSEKGGAFTLEPEPFPLETRWEAVGYAIEGSLQPLEEKERGIEVLLTANQELRFENTLTLSGGTLKNLVRKRFAVEEGETVRIDLRPIQGHRIEMHEGQRHRIDVGAVTSRFEEHLYLTLEQVGD